MSDSEQSGRIVRKPGGSGAAAPDRRVRRTRKLLHDAFIALAIEKGYEKTTIQDILDRADVGRSTFYAHYRDKAALLTASFDGMHEQLQRQLAEVPATSAIDVDPARGAALRPRISKSACLPRIVRPSGRGRGPAPSALADRRPASKAPAARIQRGRHRGARRHSRRVLYLCRAGIAGVVDRPRILQRTDLVGRDIPNARATRPQRQILASPAARLSNTDRCTSVRWTP